MRKLGRTAAFLLACCVLLAAVPAGAEMIFDGAVTGGTVVPVLAPYGGLVDQMVVQAGDRVSVGDVVAKMQTTKVYAACEGTISGVFGAEGDSSEGITERFGAVLYIEPVNKYTIACTTEKAYDRSENKFIHIGESVYLCCTADGSHQGTGIVTGIGEENKYTVQVNAGEFCLQETVGIFRQKDYASTSRIGRGTVAATAAVAVKGAGSILTMHVKNGDYVERGQLLFETVDGVLDGLFSPGSDIMSTVSGIVATVDSGAGAAVEKGAKLITIYPDDSLQVQVPVLESDLGSIYVGMPVVIEFSWDSDQNTRADGTVTRISYVNTAAEGATEPSYIACIAFTPDEKVRLGMTVLVYAQEGADAPDATEAPTPEPTSGT